MGLLRFLLACAVVISHSAPIPGLPLLGGGLAVKVFFVVSGFYMALILSEKYEHQPRGRWLFYSNRFLRIFPVYWLVLLVDLLLGTSFPEGTTNALSRSLHSDVLQVSGPLTFTSLIATEIALLGGDLFSLLGWVPGEGFTWWTTSVPSPAIRGWRTQFLPHAWTLSCEVAFYLVAPLLNRLRSRSLILLAASFTLLTLVLARLIDPRLAEVAVDFWAPLQMGFFIAGMLAWRLGKSHPQWFSGHIGLILCLTLFATLLSFNLLASLSTRGSLALLFAVSIVGVPALFARFHQSRWDRAIGDLSYPLYLCHLIPVNLLAAHGSTWFGMPAFTTSPAFPLTAILLSTLIAWLLTIALDKPINLWRQRRLTSSQCHE